MNNILLYSIAITALVVSDVLLVLLGVLAYRLYHREPTAAREIAYQEVHQDLKAHALSIRALDERLTRSETQLERLLAQGERQPLSSHKEVDHKTFEVATKLALQGAGVEEIVNLCGLTRGEAELIHRLHGISSQGNHPNPEWQQP